MHCLDQIMFTAYSCMCNVGALPISHIECRPIGLYIRPIYNAYSYTMFRVDLLHIIMYRHSEGTLLNNSVTVRVGADKVKCLTNLSCEVFCYFLSSPWADPGGGVSRGLPTPLGPRYRLFNIGPKVGPPSEPPFLLVDLRKSWIRPCSL